MNCGIFYSRICGNSFEGTAADCDLFRYWLLFKFHYFFHFFFCLSLDTFLLCRLFINIFLFFCHFSHL
jgi:hypothetical protein